MSNQQANVGLPIRQVLKQLHDKSQQHLSEAGRKASTTVFLANLRKMKGSWQNKEVGWLFLDSSC